MEPQQREREEAIRIKPKWVLKVLKWKLEGKSHSYIARELHTSTSRVSTDLNTFKKDWKRLLKFVDDVRNTNFFREQFRPKLTKIMQQGQLRMLQNELWPFATTPTCFKLDPITRRLERTPEGDSTVVKIFEGRAHNKTLRELHEETGIVEETIRLMLKNTIYKGEYDWKGYHFSWPRLAIIDQKTWNNAQSPKIVPKRYGRRPHGWRSVNGLDIEVPKALEEVRTVFTLRLKEKSFRRISEEVGLSKSTVLRIIRNPVYKERGIVDPTSWEKAQVARRSGLRILEDTAKDIRSKREKTIMYFLAQRKHATVNEIAEELGLSFTQTRYWLKLLKKEGYVDVNIPEKPSRINPSQWYLRPKSSEMTK